MARERKIVHQPDPASAPSATGCPWHDVKSMLHSLGLRPTQQRLALGWLLFAKGQRHITAEMLYEEARGDRINVSLATIYNTLKQLTDAGLLRQVAVDGSKTYFCNNTREHHHFYLEDRHELMDIPEGGVDIDNLPAPPDGYEIAKVDLVIRLRRKGS
jgi:Fur family iron response transcriptional regulator